MCFLSNSPDLSLLGRRGGVVLGRTACGEGEPESSKGVRLPFIPDRVFLTASARICAVLLGFLHQMNKTIPPVLPVRGISLSSAYLR